MSDECIHGFEPGFCAACFPPATVVVEPAKKARPVRQKPVSLREPSAARSGSRGGGETPAVAIGERRIYHAVHVDNLAGIITGDVVPDEAGEQSILSAEASQARRSTLVPGRARSVAEHVAFTLSPGSSVWESIRSGADDARLHRSAAESAPADFVILVSTIASALDLSGEEERGGLVVADGDATGALTRFASSEADVRGMLARILGDGESDVLLHAEVLVPGVFPFTRVSLIGVANDKVRDRVRTELASAAHRPRIAVYPPWFQAAEEARF
ncbi:DarT ssDNA thymidine ADP-ribosyltransferase family protein [Rathayibacter sp. YIM 133350]|uniref:DarT ssDNA thymidine ADP-ribosyltransferase family protein n=1 Tax=Rathayibacter sp. YIM 133350 TaxID=3131992 RepID=UPI00307EB6BC